MYLIINYTIFLLINYRTKDFFFWINWLTKWGIEKHKKTITLESGKICFIKINWLIFTLIFPLLRFINTFTNQMKWIGNFWNQIDRLNIISCIILNKYSKTSVMWTPWGLAESVQYKGVIIIEGVRKKLIKTSILLSFASF
jgi:hypothetical protein